MLREENSQIDSSSLPTHSVLVGNLVEVGLLSRLVVEVAIGDVLCLAG